MLDKPVLRLFSYDPGFITSVGYCDRMTVTAIEPKKPPEPADLMGVRETLLPCMSWY